MLLPGFHSFDPSRVSEQPLLGAVSGCGPHVSDREGHHRRRYLFTHLNMEERELGIEEGQQEYTSNFIH